VFNSIGVASLRRRRSRWLGSTILATLVISACGTADAQERTDPSGQPASDQRHTNLPPITVTRPDKRAAADKRTGEGSARANRQAPKPPQQAAEPVPPTTPSPNLNAVAGSSNRLGLTVRETPASVDVVNQQTIQDQGYHTNVDIAQGAIGVLGIDAGGSPAGFSMRGFTGDQINILYNGISLGPQDLTGRVMNAFMFDQVEFLKGSSALESGQGAIGGSVNYVTKQPISGPVQNEAFVAVDSLRSIRSGFDSTGTSPIKDLDYRFTIGFDHNNSFIDDDHKDISSLTTRFNYQNSEAFKSWIAFEYFKDTGQSYFGTPLVPTSMPGIVPTHGIVSGTQSPNFGSGKLVGPVTIDARTLTTNYNVTDNNNSATQYWLRGGFEWELAPNLTLKNQSYLYQAKRTFQNSEEYDFHSSTGLVDRSRFSVSHDQRLIGNIADLTWDSKVFGMDNRLTAEVAASHNDIHFVQSFPSGDSVSLIGPARGVFGTVDDINTDTRSSILDQVSQSFEDRLKITPTFALIGGVRIDEITIRRNGSADPFDDPAFSFSQNWAPVSYRAGYTWEALPKTVFYSLYATSFDPSSAAIAELQPGTPLALTSSRIYETGVKQSLWNDRIEWTLAAYDIDRRNVYEQISEGPPPAFAIAGEIETRGIEAGAAVKPTEGAKVWGNIALTRARFLNDILEDNNGNFQSFAGNTPPDVAPIIVNAGASYRFENQNWYHWLPIELGASVRHVGNRYTFDDNAITMNSYTTADAYMFVDFDKPSIWPTINKARLTFRVKNIGNATYAAANDTGLYDQVLLGAPRTYEAALSLKW